MQPYLISEFQTGISDYLQPWIRTKDAFEPLVNAYTYRGTLNKRAGYSQFGNQLADTNPVMGIIQRIDESTGLITLVAASTANLYKYNVGANTFDLVTAISNSAFWMGTATGSGKVLSTFFPNLVPSSVSITDGTTTITDNGSGGLSGGVIGSIFASGGTINYTSGVVTLNFSGSTSGVTLTVTATTTGGYFTGDNTQFFNYVNWQPTDPNTLLESTSYLYLTNNKDPLTLFDGTSLSRPILYVDTAMTISVVTTFDVNVFKNRLLLFKPTLSNNFQPQNQAIYYSAQYNPMNFQNTPGAGGVDVVATGDVFIAEEYLRDAIVLFFTNSTWLYRYSGIAADPFRIDKLSGAKRHNVPFGTVAYDERVTSLGSTGFTACDGVNVQRFDIKIVGFYEEDISEQWFSQCYTTRYDNLNQTWMLYVSTDTPFTVGSNAAPGADSALVYNFIEDSWAVYKWSVPMTCTGIYFQQVGATWASLTQSWESAAFSWKSQSTNKLTPILLMGDINGNIYWQDDEETETDNGSDFEVDATTTRWNPIMNAGQKVQFNYIDVYYSVTSYDPDNPNYLLLNFSVDNSTDYALTKTLTLDGAPNQDYYFKRIYINLIGQFLQMNIDPTNAGYMQILGFILWAQPAGRLTP